ncbi:MAG: hypothetical protein JWO46_1804 [Nocardioidaceae bacterium]|nr:hypothetical protein [Nocardioidaceae bacterium]
MPKKANPLLVKPRTKTIEILDGAAEEEIADLDRQLDEAVAAEQGPDRRMSTGPVADELATKIDARVEEIYAAATKIKLREPTHPEIEEARRANPPQEGDARQEMAGIDESGFIKSLVREAMLEPDVTDAQFEEFWESVSEFNYRAIKRAVDAFAAQGPSIPKSSAVSGLAETRRRLSKQRSGSE